jgi:hypothetical protein
MPFVFETRLQAFVVEFSFLDAYLRWISEHSAALAKIEMIIVAVEESNVGYVVDSLRAAHQKIPNIYFTKNSLRRKRAVSRQPPVEEDKTDALVINQFEEHVRGHHDWMEQVKRDTIEIFATPRKDLQPGKIKRRMCRPRLAYATDDAGDPSS